MGTNKEYQTRSTKAKMFKDYMNELYKKIKL